MSLTPGVRYGISLRATETYLDGVGGDPTNIAFANGTVYPVSGVAFVGGTTVCPDHGWSVDRTAGDSDKSTTYPRTAGQVFVNSGTTYFRVDLPNGNYKLWLAIGDITSTTSNSFMVRDGTGTAFVDQAASVSVASGSVMEIDSSIQTRANFETTQVELDVTVTQGFITIKAGSSYSQWRLSHIGFMLLDGLDVTAPVLSSLTAVEDGATGADIGFTTDEGGTAYAVITTSATPPSAAQVKAGQDHSGSAAVWDDSKLVSAGADTFTATGLTAETTYYAYVVVTDAVDNDSDVGYAGTFTTDAAGNPPVLIASHTAYRGALTKAGDGGVVDLGFMLLAVGSSTPASWSITLTSGTSGHWTTPTDGSFPTPTSTGDTADLNGGPYVFDVTATNADGTSNTCVLTINIRADTYTISAPSDWTAARGSANSTTLCGKTAEVARAATGFVTASLGVSQHNTFATNTSYHVITNEDNEYPATMFRIALGDSAYVKLNNLYTTADRSASNGHYHIANSFNGSDVTTMIEINDALIRGPVGEVENTENGIYIYYTLQGEFTVRRADMEWVTNGFAASPGTLKIYDSKVRYFTSNGIQTDTNNLTIHDTIIMSPMRDTSNNVSPGQDHVDFIQFSDNASISHDIQRLWLVQADGTASCTTQSGTLVQGPGVLKNIVSVTANANAYSPMINRGDNLAVACLTSINQTVFPGMSSTASAWGDKYTAAGAGGGEPWVRFVNSHTSVTIERVWVGNSVGGTLTGVTLGDGILEWYRYSMGGGGLQAAYDPSLVFQDYAALSTIDYESTDTDAIIAAIKAALSPDPTGPAKLSDNSYSTALYPDGGWNLALPYATKYTLSSSAGTISEDGSVTITASLLDEDDVAAVRGVDVVITLTEGGTAGNTGTYEITILAGETSGQVIATDAGTGTGSWTFTGTSPADLTDPAALSVTIGASTSPTLQVLTLSASAVNENVAIGTKVADISNNSAGGVLSIVGTHAAYFDVDETSTDSWDLVTAAALDRETLSSASIIVRETLAGAVGNPKDTPFTITINNVNEGPTVGQDPIAVFIALEATDPVGVASHFSDPEGTALTFSEGTPAPSWLDVGTDGLLTPDGTQTVGSYSFDITASDGTLDVTATVNITVPAVAGGYRGGFGSMGLVMGL